MNTNPPDLSRALKARDKQWTAKVEEDFEDIYVQSKDKLNNHQEAGKPLQLLIKACHALEIVDVDQESFKSDANVKGCIETLDEMVSKFKTILASS